nr:hypothetical protein [Tanacetum cinerariifolium]
MTTSSTNNSVFRDFFEKQKLTGPNFIDWYRQFRIVLSIEDKLNYLEQPIPPALVASVANRAGASSDYERFSLLQAGRKKYNMHNMGKTVNELHAMLKLHEQTLPKSNAYALHVIRAGKNKQAYAPKPKIPPPPKRENLVKDSICHECREIGHWKRNHPQYLAKLMKKKKKAASGAGGSASRIGTSSDYERLSLLQNYNMHSMGKTVNELHAMLKLHEQTLNLPKSNAPALHAIQAGKVQKGNKHKKSHSQKGAKGKNQGKVKFAPRPKIPPPPKKENPTKDSICHECGEIRHWKRKCPQYLAELIKKKKNTALGAGGLGIFVIELNTILNRSWIYDTGCGTHICNTMQGLRASRKLKPGALSLYVGNGQREAVKAIRAFYLYGFVNRFVDNTIQVSRNNVVYFCAIPRDGIFEIDLSNSLTNESSVYAVSNKRAKLDMDSALLWHCRLGHNSKKRIEKLQHEVLLNSSDLTTFKKCVSCMSGKMARKPYTHQVERAKDLLGLIHTDVEKTPYEVWHGKVPKLSYLKVWGCEALVKRDTLTKPDKLEPRAIKCIFVGYPKEMIGYSFYYPPENKVLVARNAEFLGNSLIDQEASGSLEDL